MKMNRLTYTYLDLPKKNRYALPLLSRGKRTWEIGKCQNG